jgi:1,4-dihydroxy-2-naphthoate octaprenyltransferase
MTDVNVPAEAAQIAPSAPGERVARSQPLVKRWISVLATTNPPRGEMDPVSKWLYLTRAGVLPMTLVSAALAGLLAAYRDASVRWGWFALAAVGLVLAHMANNLMNDLFDLEVGTDTENYPRNLYSPHPVLSGTITRRGLAACALVVNAVCLAIMLALFVERGAPIVGFALGGFLLSLAYTAPPLRLKKRGLGEPTVIAVWGPLMVGGTYYAATGTIPGAVLLASLPYAILSTTVLMGKHIDKLAWDEPAGTRTLPVMLGEARARVVTRAMFVAFYLSVIALVAVRILPFGTLLVVLSLPIARTVWRAFGEPKPLESPAPNPVWPLWFAPHAFILTRRAGGLLVLGMVVGVIVGH